MLPEGNHASLEQVPVWLRENADLVHCILLADPIQLSKLTLQGEDDIVGDNHNQQQEEQRRHSGSSTFTFDDFERTLAHHGRVSKGGQDQVVASTVNGDGSDPILVLLDVSLLVKGAFCDEVCQRILQQQCIDPALDLLRELHSRLVQLVPNRQDLHRSFLDSNAQNALQNAKTLDQVLKLTIDAGEALQQLEAQVRSGSTAAWIQAAKKECPASASPVSSVPPALQPKAVHFLVASLLYLLYKAELCESDKQTFYLQQIWAPRLSLSETGRDLERHLFEQRFGKYSEKSTAPATRTWIHTLVLQHLQQQAHGADSAAIAAQLRTSVQARKELIATGWIDTILFRSPLSSSPMPNASSTDTTMNEKALLLPEILALDVVHVRRIRHITRLASTGSALFLTVCQVSGKTANDLTSLHRESLARAMGNLTDIEHKLSEEEYRAGILSCVKEIAFGREHLKQQTNNDAMMLAFENRVLAVLNGKDPVLELLDNRIKSCFRQCIITLFPKKISAASTTTSTVPQRLQSGIGIAGVNPSRGPNTPSAAALSLQAKQDSLDQFVEEAIALFSSQGFTFATTDLAVAAKTAAKMIHLVWDVYGECLLNKIILDDVDQIQRTSLTPGRSPK